MTSKKKKSKKNDALFKTLDKWRKAEDRAQELVDLEDKSFAKNIKNFKADFDRSKKEDRGHWRDFLPEGVKHSQVAWVEEEGQALRINVGPVWEVSTVGAVPGIWIEYQRKYMNSSINGPMLLSLSIWRKINKMVEERAKKFKAKTFR